MDEFDAVVEPEVAQPEAVEAPAEPESVEPVEATPEPVEASSEPLPAEVAKLLREMRDANPANDAVSKTLKNAYYQQRAFADVFPTVDDARSMKATMDALGGSEGLSSLQENAAYVEEFNRMAEEGDPSLIQAWVSESPEGFKKIVPTVLSEYARLDPAGYNAALRGPLVSALEGSNLRQTVARAIDMMQMGQTDLAGRELTEIANWLTGLSQEQAKAVQPQFAPPPEFTAREQALAQHEEQMYQDNVVGNVGGWLEEKINTALKPLSKQPLSTDARKDLVQSIITDIDNALGQDKGYQTQINMLSRAKDVSRTADYIKANVSRLVQRSTNAVYSRRYGNVPAVKTAAPATKTATATSGVHQMTVRPRAEDIDTDRTDTGMLMRHQAILRNGTKVTWPWTT